MMNPKTKAKIEAMALINTSDGTTKAIYEKGATPWAEWCERFEAIADLDHKTDAFDEILEEYHQWLESRMDESEHNAGEYIVKLHTENQGLKAELKDCNDDQDWALNRIGELRTENQRLREALETIKCRDEASNGDHGLLGIIAKQALAETEGDE